MFKSNKFITLPIFIMILILLTACAPEELAPQLFDDRPTRQPSVESNPPIAEIVPEIDTINSEQTEGNAEGNVDNWPTRPITIVVPFLAGGDTDFYARMLAPYLEEILGQPINVVNVDGMIGTLGATMVKEAEPDGYTVLFYHTGSLFSNVLVGATIINYHDFLISCIAMHCDANVMLINPDLGINTAEEFLTFIRANPNGLRTATTTSGFSYMLLRMTENAGNFKTEAINVGGAALMITAVLTGHADVTNVSLALAANYIDNGELIPLWISAGERNVGWPDIPTLEEIGISNGYIGRSYFFAFPLNTNTLIAQRLSDAVGQVTENPEFAEQLFNAVSMPAYFVPFYESTGYLELLWRSLDGFEEFMR